MEFLGCQQFYSTNEKWKSTQCKKTIKRKFIAFAFKTCFTVQILLARVRTEEDRKARVSIDSWIKKSVSNGN